MSILINMGINVIKKYILILNNNLLIYKANMVVLFCLILYISFKKGNNLTKTTIMQFLPVSDSKTAKI